MNIMPNVSIARDFGLTHVNNGEMRMIWLSPNNQSVNLLEGKSLFKLTFKALKPIDNLQSLFNINTGLLPSVAFNPNYTQTKFRLLFSKDKTPDVVQPNVTELQIVNIFPNPFTDELKISYLSPTNDKTVTLIITDIAGRLIQETTFTTTQGYAEYLLKNTQSWAQGVYLCTLKAEGINITKRMIKF